MTTANPAVVREDGQTPATPWDIGAGRIDPDRAADPGLVLDEGNGDYIRYLEGVAPGTAVARFGMTVPPLRPLDLNLPSIAVSPLGSGATTARTFTSTDVTPTTWTLAVQGLPGVALSVAPAAVSVAPGESVSVSFAFAPAGIAPGQPSFGAVVLTGADGRTVRLPVSVVG
jgi:hypothetical protein